MCRGFSSITQLSCGPEELVMRVLDCYLLIAQFGEEQKDGKHGAHVYPEQLAGEHLPRKKSQRSVFSPSCMHSSQQMYTSVK